MSTERLLEVRNLSKRYGGVDALADVSLVVHSAEVVGLVGDNGAGKTTLVKIISGIEPPDDGEIYFDNRRVSLKNPHAAAEMGIQTVYQDLALCDTLDTVQNLFLGREIKSRWFLARRLARATMESRTRNVLSVLGASAPDLSRPVGTLSGGQRQSIAVSRSVLSDPRLVLLDEPTAALGVTQRQQVHALVARLREHGCGIIVISHDLVDVEKVADRVVVLRLGRKVAEMSRGEFSRRDLVTAITGMTDAE